MRKILREIISLAVALLIFGAARSSLADHYLVPSGSMEDTVVPGDRVLVSKVAHGVRVPFTMFKLTTGERVERGEVVVFDSPVDGVRLIKRVVAVGGDVLRVDDGHITVNGKPLAQRGPPSSETFGERSALLNLRFGGGADVGDRTIPDGFVFVMGDSRGNSLDSRSFGLVRESDIYGKAVRIVYRRSDGFMWRRL